jgi:hypothetical protein
VPKKQALPKQSAGFIETMDCLPVSKLPEGREWTYEIKLDGYRLEVVRRGRETTLYSRRQNVFNQKFPSIAAGLQNLPDDTVIDGEANSRMKMTPDGIQLLNVWPATVIREAYQLGYNQQLQSVPGWTISDRYDIEAKVDAGDVPSFRKLTFDQVREMLQPILADRFKFVGAQPDERTSGLGSRRFKEGA